MSSLSVDMNVRTMYILSLGGNPPTYSTLSMGSDPSIYILYILYIYFICWHGYGYGYLSILYYIFIALSIEMIMLFNGTVINILSTDIVTRLYIFSLWVWMIGQRSLDLFPMVRESRLMTSSVQHELRWAG